MDKIPFNNTSEILCWQQPYVINLNITFFPCLQNNESNVQKNTNEIFTNVEVIQKSIKYSLIIKLNFPN